MPIAHAAAIAPSPRLLYEWALAEARRGRLPEAREILTRLAKAPEMHTAWATLALVSYRLDDLEHRAFIARRARVHDHPLREEPKSNREDIALLDDLTHLFEVDHHAVFSKHSPFPSGQR